MPARSGCSGADDRATSRHTVSGVASRPVTAARVTVPLDEDETADHPAPGTRRPMVSTFIQPAGPVLSSHTPLDS